MRLARKLILAVAAGILLVVVAFNYSAVRDDLRDSEARVADDVATLGYGLSITLAQVIRDSGPAAAEALIARRNQGDRIQIRWVALDVPPGDRRAVELSPQAIAELRQRRPARLIRGSGPSQRLYVYRALDGEGPVHDLTEASESLAPIHDRERGKVVTLLLESLAILVLAIGATFAFGFHFVARPVQRLVAQARRIDAGDLPEPLRLEGHEELSELAEEMNRMCDRLRRARDYVRRADRLATVGTLASGVAHELGTPLNVVAGHAKMIGAAEGTREEDREGARVIAEQAVRMTAIIRQLLDFARRGKPSLEVGELAAVAARTVEMLAHLAMQRHVELRLTTNGTTRVRMDQAQVQQVVANLLLNAMQAMPKGGRVAIELGRERAVKPGSAPSDDRDYVRLAIADQGTGIAAENLPRIFEPFFTTKDVGEGTGLGLAVCYGIVEEHGGFITVDSRVGEGSRFTVYLPASGDES